MAQDILHVEESLKEKEAEFHGKDDHLGLTLMTFPQYISSTRSTMFTNHLKQFNVLNNGQFPYVFTNYENIFGKYSSSLVQAKKDYEVVARIEKFPSMPGHLYALFLYCKKEDKYEVIFRKSSANLTEKYGYRINNEGIDNRQIGDKIHKGETLYKSSSFDEDNNYRFGINARIGYMLDPGNVEDAYVISKSFADKVVSHKVESVEISINDNDFGLNIYGDTDNYKCIPDIGETVDHHIVFAKRRIHNDQVLYDMKKSNMMHISPMSDKIYYGRGYVSDIDIYANKPIDEIPDTDYNHQLREYLINQNRYFREIYEQCSFIKDSGSNYSDDIGFMLQRSKNILDPNYRWKDKESVFSNMIVVVQLDRDIALYEGSKITGRYGDKGVISEIRDDDLMPYTIDPDGSKRPLDIIANPLSCPNRLNPAQWIEMSLTHMAEQLILEHLNKAETNEEKWAMLSKFMTFFNERHEHDRLTEYYKGLDDEEKNDFWKSIETDGIYINYPPMWEGMPAIDKIQQLSEIFGFHRDTVYVKKHGHVQKIMRPITVGYKYMLKLKQDSEKNFSARSTGSLSQQGLPEKSNKVRTNEMLYSSTPIALGRDENNNLGIGVEPFMLCKLHLFYRTSPFARRQVGSLYVKDAINFDHFKIKAGYRNRNVEILNAKLKALGATIDFGFDGLTLQLDDEEMKPFEFQGKLYITTEAKMRETLLEKLMRKNFNKTKHEGTKKEIEEEYQRFKEIELERAKGKLVLDLDDNKL